jgi:CYTH domain-containing protein
MEKRTEIEKERKWVLKDLPALAFSKIINITQYYKDGWRYRMEQEFGKNPEYIKLKKEKVAEGINKEVDIETIDAVDYHNNKFGTIKDRREISKKRYVYEYEGKKFEVDVFNSVSLTMLEIEGIEMKDKINFPPEIEKMILIEVTGNKKFDNYSLAE